MFSLIRGNLLKGWLFLANLSMQKKLIVIFVFLISMPITYVTYLSARSTLQSVLENATNNAVQMTANASNTLDSYVADLKRYTVLPLYNKEVQYYLEQKGTNWDKNVSIGMFLSYLNHTKEEISAVYLVDKFGSVFYDKNTTITELYPYEQLAQWNSLIRNNGGAPIITGRHTIRANSNGSKEVFTVLRTVKSASTLKDIGIIAFDTDIKIFKQTFDPVNQVTGGSSMIVDSQGKPLFANDNGGFDPANQLSLLLKQVNLDQGSFQSEIGGQKYLTVYKVSQETGWIMLHSIPLNHILSSFEQNRSALILTTLIILAFALLVATFISYALTRPLKSMVRLMKQVQRGHLGVSLTPKYNDEIGLLGHQFNRMITRIKDLLEEVSITEKRKQKADMRALQNQINPHFIYNTLESIRMLAESNDDPRVAELTYLLGLQMRYSISRSEETVTIAEELEHVRNYFQLLQIRFPGKFELELDIPDAFLELPVLKLVFQPIVENAVFHGLEKKSGPGLLTITAWSRDDNAMFLIKDNGVGMSKDKLLALNNNLQSAEPGENFGIGLRNVNERLCLHYGYSYGLQVESELGVGTSVTLQIQGPTLYETEDNTK
ncbi:sensor histidine kinase [Paenibacillus sp. J22TS3]|uniref:cache domain-containing sensor histidine kinase n=1 Tax=Paenibacillus sp. J22TS3 TaxID=2807192 RepID=UPI001B249E4A|nr:sensor histidine kinase [Paenibacillus sp. J22TS3]GIP21636.1 sensor histidine kinase [Paenibacillus sp. J22TS3]